MIDPEALLPDAPENPEFNELFTEGGQVEITRRFHAGIEKNYEGLQLARKRQAARAARSYDARRRRPVLRSRP